MLEFRARIKEKSLLIQRNVCDFKYSIFYVANRAFGIRLNFVVAVVVEDLDRVEGGGRRRRIRSPGLFFVKLHTETRSVFLLEGFL